MWKEAIVAYLRYYPIICLKRMRKTTKYLTDLDYMSYKVESREHDVQNKSILCLLCVTVVFLFNATSSQRIINEVGSILKRHFMQGKLT
jgi:hypothetical protein